MSYAASSNVLAVEQGQQGGQSKFLSQSVRRNSIIFGIIMICLQIAVCLIYGFLITVPPSLINIGSVITTIGLGLLVVAGFGLVFGYTRRLIWSGIGFTFFLTALSIQLYPLINDFWTKTVLQNQNSPLLFFDYADKNYNLFLSNRETATTGTASYYGNCISNAIKCALSCAIAFSAILGRAGHLQCLLVGLFGIVGFELNRQVIQQNQGADSFGTFYIFTFGGFMGLTLGIWSFGRQTRVIIKEHEQGNDKGYKTSLKRYDGSEYSVLYSLFGSLIIFALFPFLAYQIDAYTYFHNYSAYSNPLCIILAMGAGTIGAIFVSLFIHGYIIARDVIHGPIAGAIAVGASSLYITNPTYALVAGCAGGIIQSIIQNIIETPAVKSHRIISSVSWCLFGFQGIVGAAFAAGWKAIVYTSVDAMLVEPKAITNFSSQFQFYAGLISAGIGAGFGLLCGLVIFLVNSQKSNELYEDYYYWKSDDGIRTFVRTVPIKRPSVPEQAKPESQLEPQPSHQNVSEMQFSQRTEEINKHSYL